MQGSQSAAHGSALPFAALNGALATDVACVIIPPGVHVDRPLHILYLSTGMSHQHGIPRLGTKTSGFLFQSLAPVPCLVLFARALWDPRCGTKQCSVASFTKNLALVPCPVLSARAYAVCKCPAIMFLLYTPCASIKFGHSQLQGLNLAAVAYRELSR